MSKFETDVKGVYADDVYNYGISEIPMFNVGRDTYYSRVENEFGEYLGRKRLRMEPDSNLYNYVHQTEIRNPIALKYSEDGQDFIKIVK